MGPGRYRACSELAKAQRDTQVGRERCPTCVPPSHVIVTSEPLSTGPLSSSRDLCNRLVEFLALRWCMGFDVHVPRSVSQTTAAGAPARRFIVITLESAGLPLRALAWFVPGSSMLFCSS